MSVINRRKALVAITMAFARITKGNGRAQSPSAAISGANVDLSQIGSHVYSEEGIPMFLGCEDTAASQNRVMPSDLNRRVSSAFEHYAKEWVRLHPSPEADDAAKLVEFIAGRDFNSGGLERSL